MMERFENSPDANWVDLLEKGNLRTPTGNIALVVIGTGVFTEIERNHGRELFLRRFFQEELPKLSQPKTNKEAFDNFYHATSSAAQADLDELLIKRLRWPVSESGRE